MLYCPETSVPSTTSATPFTEITTFERDMQVSHIAGGEVSNALATPGPSTDDLPMSVQENQEEQVIRVDRRDQVQGYAGKLEVHRAGLLHRAFSVLVFNAQGHLLLQRRAGCKYHFAGLWSNTCCGHPRPGETTTCAASRRLEEEFGFTTHLVEFAQLVYQARDPVSTLVEHEYLHVFRGLFPGKLQPNPDEVDAWRWMSVPHLRQKLRESPDSFTPWFALLTRDNVLG
jgi:isopentenyl-diphosphate delta-isomerase